MSSGKLLDASALLAIIFRESGHEIAAAMCPASISAVNLSEVVARLTERGVPTQAATAVPNTFGLTVLPLTEEAASRAGLLRATTKSLGLSLGDRCCLAVGQLEGLEIVTADAAWEGLAAGLNVTITNIRPRAS